MANQVRKQYTAAFKAKIVQEVWREDRSLAQIAAEHGLHPNLISQWKAAAAAGLPTLFERGQTKQTADKADHERQIADLYEQIGRLSAQVAWMKKKSGLDPDKK